MSLRRDVPRRKPRRRVDQVVFDLLLPGELRPWVRVVAAAVPLLAVAVPAVVVLVQPR